MSFFAKTQSRTKTGLANPAQTATFKDMLNSASSLIGSMGGLYGSYSHGHDETKDSCQGLDLAALLTAFASIAVVFFTVYTKLTMLGRRRKRSAVDGDEIKEDYAGSVLDNFQDIVMEGRVI